MNILRQIADTPEIPIEDRYNALTAHLSLLRRKHNHHAMQIVDLRSKLDHHTTQATAIAQEIETMNQQLFDLGREL